MSAAASPVAIMVVDDNDLAAAALERWFSRMPSFRWVGWASNAQEALARATSAAPDVLLLDVEMPGVDTFELLAQLASRTRVVMLSGHVRPDYIERALEAGAAGYIVKDEPMAVIAELAARAARGECVLSPAAAKSFLGPQ